MQYELIPRRDVIDLGTNARLLRQLIISKDDNMV